MTWKIKVITPKTSYKDGREINSAQSLAGGMTAITESTLPHCTSIDSYLLNQDWVVNPLPPCFIHNSYISYTCVATSVATSLSTS